MLHFIYARPHRIHWFALALSFSISACKRKADQEADLQSFRTGVNVGNSCYSDANYHRRVKEELAILSKEFIDACFVVADIPGADAQTASAEAAAPSPSNGPSQGPRISKVAEGAENLYANQTC